MLLNITRFFSIILSLFLLNACAESSNKSSDSTATELEATTANKQAIAADPSRSAVYEKGLALVAQSDCLTCHKVEDQMTGPSYRAIAEKYAGAPNEVISALAGTIIKGGVGNWGNVPMTPHPSLSQDDAETMVRYILELNKK